MSNSLKRNKEKKRIFIKKAFDTQRFRAFFYDGGLQPEANDKNVIGLVFVLHPLA